MFVSRVYCINFIKLSAHNVSKYSELTKEVKYVLILIADDSSAVQKKYHFIGSKY